MKKILVALIVACFLMMGLIGTGLFMALSPRAERIMVSSYTVNLNVPQLSDVTGKKMSDVKIHDPTREGEYDKLVWTFSKKFSKQDIALAKLSVVFMEKITGLSYNCDYSNMYWSDDMLTSMGTNGSLLGMTVFHEYRDPWRAYIAISSKLRPQSPHDLNAMRDFGSTVIHECLHASNLDIEETVRVKIERPIDMSFDLYCSVTVSNFHAFKLDRFTNAPYTRMIEKAAFEAGIKAPWHYTRDYLGDPIRPIIQILMVPPPTNTVRLGPTNN